MKLLIRRDVKRKAAFVMVDVCALHINATEMLTLVRYWDYANKILQLTTCFKFCPLTCNKLKLNLNHCYETASFL